MPRIYKPVNNALVGFIAKNKIWWYYMIIILSLKNFLKLKWKQMVYRHNDTHNTKNNANTGGTNECFFFFQPSVLWNTKRETRMIKAYANHTILTPPRSVHLVVSKISTHLCLSKPKRICSDQIRKKPTARFIGRTSTTRLFKILKLSGRPLPGTTSAIHLIHSNGYPAPFPAWGLKYDGW